MMGRSGYLQVIDVADEAPVHASAPRWKNHAALAFDATSMRR